MSINIDIVFTSMPMMTCHFVFQKMLQPDLTFLNATKEFVWSL